MNKRTKAIFIDCGAEYKIDKEHIENMFLAKNIIFSIQNIETYYDALITAFTGFKADAYRETLESSTWPTKPYKEAHKTRVRLNIALASVLNSARSLTDKLQGRSLHNSGVDVFSCSEKMTSLYKRLDNLLIGEYDGNINYFLMYISRNHLQHNGLIIDKIVRGSCCRHDGFHETKLSITIDLKSLRKELEVDVDNARKKDVNRYRRKLERLNSIEKPVHLLVALESYIVSISKVMEEFREIVLPIYENEKVKHCEAVEAVVDIVKPPKVYKERKECYMPYFAKYEGSELPLSLEWDLVEHLKNKNAGYNIPLDTGNSVMSLDYGRRTGYYDKFYDSLGLIPPK